MDPTTETERFNLKNGYFSSTFLKALTSISVCDKEIDLSSKARNIAVIFDTSMSMENHIAAMCMSAFYHLRNISRMRKYLSLHTAEMLVRAFVSSRLDFCNSLLFGLLKPNSKEAAACSECSSPDCDTYAQM